MKIRNICPRGHAASNGPTRPIVLIILVLIGSLSVHRTTSASIIPSQEPRTEAELAAAVARKQQESIQLVRTEAGEAHFAELRTRVDDAGLIPVIVRLRAAYRPEGELRDLLDIRAQRSVISNVRARVMDEISGYDASSIKDFEYVPYVALKVNATGLASLQASANVLDVEEDGLKRPSLTQSVALIGANNAWSNGYTGAGQTVAIIDTGVDKNHPFLAGKVVSEACYSTAAGGSTSLCPGGVPTSTATDAGLPCGISDDCSHGTHVAGIAAGKGSNFSGVAKDSNIVAIQVFSRFDSATRCDGNPPCALAFTSDIIKGLERVYELRNTYPIAAANLSLGGGQYSADCDSAEAATKSAIDLLRSAGIATTVASGNEAYTNALGAPACISTAISVGSVSDTTVGVSSFSNSSSRLTLLAPGGGITSSVPGAGFETWSGTSMAAPHAAGAWAILKQKMPRASVVQVLDAFTATGQGIKDSRNEITKPLIKVDAAVALLGNQDSVTAPTAPTSLTATTISASQINLSWTDNSINESGFKIYRKAGNSTTWTLVSTVGVNISAYQNTGLTSGTTYTYYVVATNIAGDSPATNEASATTPALPSTPISLKATAASTTQINLSWTDTSNNETGFRVRARTSPTGSWSIIGTVTQNITTFQISGLTTGQTYYYAVTSFNSSGESPLSNQASATTVSANVPAAPSELTAVATSSTQVTLTWVDNSNNETGFRVSRKTAAEGVWRVIGTLAAGTRTARNSGLTAGTAYVFRIVSYNSSGESDSSNEATVTTPLAVPAPPSTLEAAAISSSRINLTWVDNSSNEAGFKIYRRTASSSAWSSIGSVEANVNSFQNLGLDPSITYSYRVTAWNSGGESSASNEVSATTPSLNGEAAPTAPSGLQGTAISTSQVSLAWVDTSTNETGFLIQRRAGANDSWTTVGTTPPNTTTFVNSELLSNTTYSFRIRAINGSTESNGSNEVSLILPDNSFTNLSNAQSVSDSVSRSGSKYYKLYVPAGASQLVIQTTGTGDVDLYLRADNQPSRFIYSCRSIASNSTERCAISAPKSGDWHILIYGYGSSANNFSVTASYQGGAPVRFRTQISGGTPPPVASLRVVPQPPAALTEQLFRQDEALVEPHPLITQP